MPLSASDVFFSTVIAGNTVSQADVVSSCYFCKSFCLFLLLESPWGCSCYLLVKLVLATLGKDDKEVQVPSWSCVLQCVPDHQVDLHVRSAN